MDTGEMLLQKEMEIGATETAPQVAQRLAEAGAPLMVETLRGIAAGKLQGRPQNNEQATYAPLLKKEDGRINWTQPAEEIYNRMRGFTPWPGAFSTFQGQTVHIWAEPVAGPTGKESGAPARRTVPLAPGALRSEASGLFVACGGATELRVLSVKRQGGRSVGAAEFLHGVRLTEGERFSNS
jgi:methionyl-tRNA formyltransferase